MDSQGFTQEDIDQLKTDLQTYFDDFVKDGKEGEWGEQLREIFVAAYGEDFVDVLVHS